MNWYLKFVKKFKEKPTKPKKEIIEALEFLGWDIKPGQIANAASTVLLIGMLISVVILGFLYIQSYVLYTFILPMQIFMLIAAGLIFAPFFLGMYIQNYPVSYARVEQLKALTYIPEIVNYMVMSLRLTPNLEKAVEFAARHGRGKIADELRDILWKTHIGYYASVEEGLDELAYKWGRWAEEFKHALTLIRRSILEVDAEKRELILERAVEDVLEGIKEKMDMYARGLHQPAIRMYYFGVLLPLLLIIILPIGSVFSRLPMARTEVMVIVYNIAIPLLAFFMAKGILKQRPPTYVPPDIPDDFPELPPKGKMKLGKEGKYVSIKFVAFLIFALCVLVGIIAHQIYLASIPSWEWETADKTPYFVAYGAIMGVSLAISFWLYMGNIYKRKVQKRIMKMEEEFQDAVYIIASRLGEAKPVEEAIRHTMEFHKDAEISRTVLKKAYDNITSLGLTLEAALFDEIYGALKYVPSNLIRSGFRIVVDAVQLGAQVAAKSLISLAAQVRDARRIDAMLRKLLQEVIGMMKTMTTIVAPIVLGVTTALQRIIVDSFAKMKAVEMGKEVATPTIGMSFSSFMEGKEVLEQSASPLLFLIIVGLYMVEITLILAYFTSVIENGEDKVGMKISMAKIVPISVGLFLIVTHFARAMIGVT